MSTHDKLYEVALEAIKALFNDKSVPQGTTASSLAALADEIDMMDETLE